MAHLDVEGGRKPVIVDQGSGFMKCGFGGDEAPSKVFPSVVGSSREYPIKGGVMTDRFGMEKLWLHSFQELEVDPKDFRVFLTDSPFSPDTDRMNAVHVMFETFRVAGTYIKRQAVLDLYTIGRQSGLVLDVGDDVAHAVPVNEGYIITHAVSRTNLGGRHLRDALAQALRDRETGIRISTPSEIDAVNKMKETCCYVASDPQIEQAEDAEYVLPDGRRVTIGEDRFRIPELLFGAPTGVQFMISQMAPKLGSPSDSEPIYKTICICGGSSMFRGFLERVEKEVRAIAPVKTAMDFCANSERNISTWIGGSLMSMLSSVEDSWITKAEYDECGPGIVRRKCQ